MVDLAVGETQIRLPTLPVIDPSGRLCRIVKLGRTSDVVPQYWRGEHAPPL